MRIISFIIKKCYFWLKFKRSLFFALLWYNICNYLRNEERGSIMKALNYIPILALLALSSCTSRIYTGLEYDDLYYRKSDMPAVTANTRNMDQSSEQNLKAKDYYDNVYAADTLVSDEYANAVNNNTSGNQILNYYDLDSYSGRLGSFYGNYFNPYWRDPYYYSWGYPSLSWGFGYDPFFYNRYGYGYGYDYGFGYPYGGYYGGYWGGYYGYSPYYSSWYSPYYGYNVHSDMNSISYGRRERESNYSSSWNRNISTPSAGSRRGGDLARGSSYTPSERSGSVSSATNSASRRPQSTMSVQQNTSRNATQNTRSDYNSSSRTYTPSYNNPRMSTRPSYNTSRVNSELNNSRPSNSNSSGSGSSYSRSGSSSSVQTRSSSSNSQSSYSLPSRRAVESGSGSYNSGRSSSSSSPSYSSGSSSSRSSYSSGSGFSGSSGSSSSSSSSSSSGSRSSSGGSSGGRR